MSEKRDRLAVKIFSLVEGEAEGRFAIGALIVIVMAVVAWRVI